MLRNRLIGSVCTALGVLCLTAGAITHVASRNLFDARAFGSRVSESLSDPGVAGYVSETITDSIIRSRANLIAIRPFIQATVSSLVATRPFRIVLGDAARQAHEAAFSEGAQRLILSIPDLEILVRDALAQTNPELAARIPKELQTAIASLGESRSSQLLVDVWKLGRRLRWIWEVLFFTGTALLLIALWATADRVRGLERLGKAIIGAGLILATLIPATRISAAVIQEPEKRELARGLIRAFFGDLNNWAWFFCGLGVLIAAGASSRLERVDPVRAVRHFLNHLTMPPLMPGPRLLWGLILLVMGNLAILYPLDALRALVVAAGLTTAYIGIREVFRIIRETLQKGHYVAGSQSSRSLLLPFVAIVALLPILSALWVIRRNPAIHPAPDAEVAACNGYADLCDRRVDEVTFAATHNSMSNQNIAGWMFPHQEANMPQQLRDGIRALLFDVHRGFSGGSRIKTDMSTEPNAEKIIGAVGKEGYDAALRIRNRLVGVDEGRANLYLCHGFCELGAYLLTPLLAEIRSFLVGHPDEVLIFIIEDYASPAEIAKAFDESGLTEFVYQGPGQPNWPTLRELIQSRRRVIVFLESGRPGVAWLRPAFSSVRETPYTFHSPNEFTCIANRGGNGGSLFLLNHWIDTTPAPRPSNAAIVNSFPVLSTRALQCAKERDHLPNIVAVDFYRTGDLFRVVDQLNRVPVELPGAHD